MQHLDEALPTNPLEVRSAIKKLKDGKAPGYDEIKTEAVKALADIICYPLSEAINVALNDGSYPNILKLSVITPIFKSGNYSDPNNYRPISVLPTFAKIFDAILYTRLYGFLINKTKQISQNQFGFRKKSSTENAVIEIVENALSAIDNHQLVGGLFLDLSKAFDTINHSYLLRKLESMGVRNNALAIFKNYLQNRKQIVKWDDTRSSDTSSCNAIGTPQGSKLSSLLFLVYINDIERIFCELFLLC